LAGQPGENTNKQILMNSKKSSVGAVPRVLILGTGSIGERHLRCFQKTGQCAVGVCELDDGLRADVSKRYSCEAFAGVDDALESGEFSAVVICTPAHTHIPLARRCLEAGLHVLIEKPLAVSLEGTSELAAEAEAAQREIRVAYIYRFLPVIRKARELLQSSRFGKIRHIVVCGGQHFPTFRPAYRSIYYARRETGGGAIQDALTHQIHAVEWMTAPVVRVVCHAAHQVLPDVEVEDTVNLSAVLSDGAMASFSLNQFQAVNETILTFHGTRGSLRVELPLQRIGEFLNGAEAWQWEQLPAQERDAAFIDQALDFLKIVRGDPAISCPLSEGIQTLRVNLAALRSDETRKEICV